MDRLEDRVRTLETQLSRYRLLLVVLYLVVALVLVGCAAFVISNLLSLKEHIRSSAPPIPGWNQDQTVRTRRLEILDATSTRPVCVLRAVGGGGRVEVMDRLGRPIAGFDGNTGTVVRSGDGPRFPETRPPR
jgi:uncharacterized protein YceK